MSNLPDKRIAEKTEGIAEDTAMMNQWCISLVIAVWEDGDLIQTISWIRGSGRTYLTLTQ